MSHRRAVRAARASRVGFRSVRVRTALLALLAGVLGAACGSDATVPGPRAGSSTTASSGEEAGAFAVEVISDGQLYRVAGGSAQRVDVPYGLLPGPYAVATRTELGLVALADRPGSTSDLVLVGDRGSTTLATDAYSFAVDATGTRVAVATTPGQVNTPGGTTALTVIDLADRSAHEQTTFAGIDGGGSNASIVGWAGDVVALDLGDGAGSRIGMWRPGADAVTVAGHGTVVATDPSRRRAVLSFGDRGCGAVAELAPDLAPDRAVAQTDPSPIFCSRTSFAPGGADLARIDGGTGRLVVRDTQNLRTERVSIALPDTAAPVVGDVAFVDAAHVVVTRRNDVTVCDLSGACEQTVVPARGPTVTAIVLDRRRRTDDRGTGPTTTPAPTTSAPTRALGDGVRFGRDGLWYVDDGTVEATPRVTGPVTAAFRFGDGRLLYQRSESTGRPDGPIVRRTGDASTERALVGSGPLDRLLDVARGEDGRWRALIARRSGTDPDDTLALVLHDLGDDTMRVLRQENGWEVGYQSARITDAGILFVEHATITQRYGFLRADGTEWTVAGAPDRDAFVAISDPALGPVVITNQRSILFVDPAEPSTARVTTFPAECAWADLAASGLVACTRPDRTTIAVDTRTMAIVGGAFDGTFTFTRR